MNNLRNKFSGNFHVLGLKTRRTQTGWGKHNPGAREAGRDLSQDFHFGLLPLSQGQ